MKVSIYCFVHIISGRRAIRSVYKKRCIYSKIYKKQAAINIHKYIHGNILLLFIFAY